jgi:hypothetical protein
MVMMIGYTLRLPSMFPLEYATLQLPLSSNPTAAATTSSRRSSNDDDRQITISTDNNMDIVSSMKTPSLFVDHFMTRLTTLTANKIPPSICRVS